MTALRMATVLTELTVLTWGKAEATEPLAPPYLLLDSQQTLAMPWTIILA